MGAEEEFSRKLLGFMPCRFFAVLNLSFPGERTSVRLLKLALFGKYAKHCSISVYFPQVELDGCSPAVESEFLQCVSAQL